MHADTPFRLVLALLAVPMLSTAAYYRVRAARAGDKLDRRQEGIPILVSLRLSGLAFWIAMVSWLVHPPSIEWSRLDLPAGLRWIGAPLLAIAFLWMVWVMKTLGHNLTDTVVTRARATLVTAGPYRWVRNPLYSALIPVGLAVCLLAASWFFAPVMLLAFLPLVIRTRKEEANLIARFGDDYRSYMATTGRFLPKPARRGGRGAACVFTI